MNRLVGIAYGRRRIGIAMTEPMRITVQGQPTLSVAGFDKALAEVKMFLDQYEVDRIVLGLPLNMDGSRGEMAKEVERFGGSLKALTGLDVVFWDERLTSEQAKQIIQQRHGTKEKDGVDRVAAGLLLASYLQAHPG